MESTEINARSLLEIASRRRWALLLPFLSFLLLAGWLCVVIPRAYQGEAVLLYQPRVVPKDYVQQLSPFGTEDSLRAVTQRITGRQKLLAVAAEFNLYPNATEAERAELMRRATSVEVIEEELRKDSPYRASRTPSEVTAFKLIFEAAEPEVAAKATNRLAELLVAQSHQTASRQVSKAGKFLDQELEAARQRLQTQEVRLEGFKQQYAGELPEQVQVNTSALATAQLQLQALSQQKAESKQKVLEARQRITELVHGVASLGGGGASGREINPLLAQLQDKRDEVQLLRSRYTPRHPDVVRAKSELAQLERKLTGGGGDKFSKDAAELIRGNPLLKDLSAQLEAAEEEQRRLAADEAATREAILMYQRRIDVAPRRAQDMETLSRDYSAMEGAYQAVLGRKLETKMAANLESEEAGDQFTILDKSAVPESPARPSFRKIFVFCTLIGMMLGMVGATVFEFSDDSLRDEGQAEGFLKLPVLASVPKLQTAVELEAARRRRARLIMIAVLVASGYVVSLILLWLNGVHLRMPV
jgi:succinoglycan biosynthesis transport protein ExoP